MLHKFRSTKNFNVLLNIWQCYKKIHIYTDKNEFLKSLSLSCGKIP